MCGLKKRFPGCSGSVTRKEHGPNTEIRKRIGRQLKAIWTADDLARAETALAELFAGYRDTASKLASWFEENGPEGLAVFMLPEHHRTRLRMQPDAVRGWTVTALTGTTSPQTRAAPGSAG